MATLQRRLITITLPSILVMSSELGFHALRSVSALRVARGVPLSLSVGPGSTGTGSGTNLEHTLFGDEPASILGEEEMAEISRLVARRAAERSEGNYEAADALRDEIDTYALPDGYQIRITDLPRRDGGGSSWTLVRLRTPLEGPTVLQLAHAALGLAVSCSDQGITFPSERLHKLVRQAKSRLQQEGIVEDELGGRKAADAAFWFTLAGVNDDALLHQLTEIAFKELERFGERPSCRSKDVWQILLRLGAVGVRHHAPLEELASRLLTLKGDKHRHPPLLDLHSDKSLLMIWKFSTRQRKQRIFLECARQHWEAQQREDEAPAATTTDQRPNAASDKSTKNGPTAVRLGSWKDVYADPSKPLLVDIGCGMGVSLLGLADGGSLGDVSDATTATSPNQHPQTKPSPLLSSGDFNFAGVDLSGLAISYANSLARQFHLDNRLAFFVDSAQTFVDQVLPSYPGPIRLVMIQFPTPYRLQSEGDSDDGNAQLPSDPSSGFMVTPTLLDSLYKLQLQKQQDGSMLLLQSNCEDVAIWMKQKASDVGFKVVSNPENLLFYDEGAVDNGDCRQQETTTSPTKRTLDWIASMGADVERASGDKWASKPLLPRRGRTETEVACSLNGTPVHRCLLKATSTEEK